MNQAQWDRLSKNAWVPRRGGLEPELDLLGPIMAAGYGCPNTVTRANKYKPTCPQLFCLATIHFIGRVHPLYPLLLYFVTITTASYGKWQSHYQERQKMHTCPVTLTFSVASVFLSNSLLGALGPWGRRRLPMDHWKLPSLVWTLFYMLGPDRRCFFELFPNINWSTW